MKEILFYCNTFSNQLKIDRPKGNRDHSTYCFALIRRTDMVKVQFQNICMKSAKIEKQAKGRKSYRYNAPGKRGDCLTNVTV